MDFRLLLAGCATSQFGGISSYLSWTLYLGLLWSPTKPRWYPQPLKLKHKLNTSQHEHHQRMIHVRRISLLSQFQTIVGEIRDTTIQISCRGVEDSSIMTMWNHQQLVRLAWRTVFWRRKRYTYTLAADSWAWRPLLFCSWYELQTNDFQVHYLPSC